MFGDHVSVKSPDGRNELPDARTCGLVIEPPQPPGMHYGSLFVQMVEGITLFLFMSLALGVNFQYIAKLSYLGQL